MSNNNKDLNFGFNVNKPQEEEKVESPNSNINLGKKQEVKSEALKKLGFSLWFFNNRKKLFIGLIVFLFVLSAVLYSVFFYNLYDYIRYSPEERRALQELSNVNVNLSPGRLALALIADTPQSFFQNGKYDLVAKVKNPNNNFFSHLEYCFSDRGEDLICSNILLFPNEERYIMALALDLEKSPSALSFDIKKENWERLSVRTYPDWDAYYTERLNFTFSDIKMDIDKVKGFNNLSFQLKNNSPYNYWELSLDIILFQGGRVVGVNSYTVNEIMSLESRSITLSWPGALNAVGKVEIVPRLNILDEKNYISYK